MRVPTYISTYLGKTAMIADLKAITLGGDTWQKLRTITKQHTGVYYLESQLGFLAFNPNNLFTETPALAPFVTIGATVVDLIENDTTIVRMADLHQRLEKQFTEEHGYVVKAPMLILAAETRLARDFSLELANRRTPVPKAPNIRKLIGSDGKLIYRRQ